MIGLGLDAVDLARFRAVLARRPALIERLFTASERADVARRVDPVPGLAARFAAKEAAMKALGVGIGSFAFCEVEVVRSASGAPEMRASGRAAAHARRLGVTAWHVSLTHSSLVASAVVCVQ